ncbi:DNA primase [Hongsoonwoonella zoysiae]|uniref:DNA primase n=1 Tax=Hongsoonwoonella zoysiae TaxID=2821844 RepID=UPI001AED936B|nr:DNA primase [Hongsoonwoonella zoysiae]
MLDEIRDRMPLSDVVARRVSWDRRKTQAARGDFWACCPFHQEKTPSFHVDDRRGRYKCFGCGASGDHFRFLTDTEGLSFPEAVERLADQTGVALPKPDPQAEKREQRRASLAEICEMAARFFQAEFATSSGTAARDYCARRGLKAETLKEFRFGFAPNGRDALKRHLISKGVDEADMIEAGLVIKPDDGRASYDRFRNRLIIPIQDDRGRVVAFGGRTLDPDGQPKYLNSPETPLFHKGALVFNAHRAREVAFQSGQLIAVEGYLDAISLWQAGIGYVVATLGTAFTEEQIRKMWRMAPEPIICFDGDAAGKSAAERAVDRILPNLKGGYSFNFVFIPNGQDPDDVVRSGGAKEFLSILSGALNFSNFFWERETANVNIETPERKAALEASIYKHINAIKDDSVKHKYRIMFRLKLSHLFWESNVGKRRRNNRVLGVEAPEGNLVPYERLVLGMSVEYTEIYLQHMERVSRITFSEKKYNIFRDEIYKVVMKFNDLSVIDFYEELAPQFHEVLDEVYGRRKLIVNDMEIYEYGYRLKQRMKILECNPTDDFVEHCYLHFVSRLEIREIERELDLDTGDISDEEIDEAQWERFQALIMELNRLREEYHRDDATIAEWAKSFSKFIHREHTDYKELVA